MPEGPEVRRHADALQEALGGKPIRILSARTRVARAWLEQHPQAFLGRCIERVFAHGKNLVGQVEGGLFFYSHLLMWGRWTVEWGNDDPPKDRRERARIAVPGVTALLLSAPIFEVGEGDPYQCIETLGRLGPDILPVGGPEAFDEPGFLARLFSSEHRERTIGAALLDQTIIAGIGNYLRAEILFACRLDPWRRVADLTTADVGCLCRTIPQMADLAYRSGSPIADEQRERMRADASLVYRPSSDWGTRHAVFRRTNLPCLACGDTIRQQRQVTHTTEEGDTERIIYFCPSCQGTSQPLKPIKRRPAAELPGLKAGPIAGSAGGSPSGTREKSAGTSGESGNGLP